MSIEDGDSLTKQYIDRDKLKFYEKKIDRSEQVLKNGLMALFTGLYPRIFKKNMIKHLYFEQLEDAEKLHPSVYLNCAINYGLYIDELEKILIAKFLVLSRSKILYELLRKILN